MSEKHPFNPNTCDYLESIGLDPHTVGLHGLDERGYWAFELDENGKRERYPEGGWVKNWNEWPASFRWDEFFTAAIEDGFQFGLYKDYPYADDGPM
jgi:hypothetical protein